MSSLRVPARILVVDDEPDCTLELVEHLEMNGHACTGVTDPREALRVFAADPSVGLVVSDVKMPGMDGIALTRAVSETAGASRPVAFVLVTGHAGINEAKQALHLGAVDFILKPIDLDDLDRAIDRAMQRVRASVSEAAAVPALVAAIEAGPGGEAIGSTIARLLALPALDLPPPDNENGGVGTGTALGPLVADLLERNGPAVTSRSLRTIIRGEAAAGGRSAVIEAALARLVGAAVRASPAAGSLEIVLDGGGERARIVMTLPVEQGARAGLLVDLALAAAWARLAGGTLSEGAAMAPGVSVVLDLPGAA